MKLLRLTGPFLLSALIVSPQTTDPVIRVDVTLRQVDLVVTDAKGNHVSGLQPADFQILEDGKPQNITNFSWVEVTPPPSGARLAALQEKPSLPEWYSGVARFRKTPGNDILSAPVANLYLEARFIPGARSSAPRDLRRNRFHVCIPRNSGFQASSISLSSMVLRLPDRGIGCRARGPVRLE